MNSILSPSATSEDILCIRLSYKSDLAAIVESIEEVIEFLTAILCERILRLGRGMRIAGSGTPAGRGILSTVKNVAENEYMFNQGR